ncbi:hypothetical protein Noda2021_11340 [Candidatus Dependentiae bacterium Noda2021]|nr:hypothetical protein Noda2021_11340 [Candidatus Dependentiae bacterium Noda2021]
MVTNKKLLFTILLCCSGVQSIYSNQGLQERRLGSPQSLLSAAKNPKNALDQLTRLIEQNPMYGRKPYLDNALSYIANKFPCSGYFLSYNLPVEVQKDFERWYDNYVKNNPQETLITSIINKMSTFHDDQLKIAPQDQALFRQIQVAEIKDLFKHLQEIGVNLNDVIFCEELDHNLITYAFSKDVNYPEASPLTELVLESSDSFDVNKQDPQGKTFLEALQELVNLKLQESDNAQTAQQLQSLVEKIKIAIYNYQPGL